MVLWHVKISDYSGFTKKTKKLINILPINSWLAAGFRSPIFERPARQGVLRHSFLWSNWYGKNLQLG